MALQYMTDLSVGNDQMANQFQARFVNVPPTTSQSTSQLTLRVKGSIDPPDNQIATYEVEYQGIKYSMLSAKDDTDKTITITFRLDADWTTYDILKNWMTYTFNYSKGSSSDTFSNKATTQTVMYIDAFKGNKVNSSSIQYDNVRITSLKVNSFDQTSNEPSELECVFIYEAVGVVSNASATAIGTNSVVASS
jgi:hypothetical protein